MFFSLGYTASERKAISSWEIGHHSTLRRRIKITFICYKACQFLVLLVRPIEKQPNRTISKSAAWKDNSLGDGTRKAGARATPVHCLFGDSVRPSLVNIPQCAFCLCSISTWLNFIMANKASNNIRDLSQRRIFEQGHDYGVADVCGSPILVSKMTTGKA